MFKKTLILTAVIIFAFTAFGNAPEHWGGAYSLSSR